MTCDDVEQRLSAHLDGELSSREGRDVDEHLASCVPCRRRLEVLLAVRAAVRSLESDAVSESFEARLDLRLAKLRSRRARPRWRPLAVALAAAATLMLVALGFLIRRQSPAHPRPIAATDMLLPSDARSCLHCAALPSETAGTAGRPCADPLSCGLVVPGTP